MPDDVTPNEATTPADAPADAPATTDAPADAPDAGAGSGAANIPERPSVRDIFAAEEAKAKAAAEAEAAAPAEDPAPAESDDDADKPGDDADKPGDDADKPGDAPADDEDKPDGDKPAEPVADADAAAAAADAAKEELDRLLETYDDPNVLNAALTKAGVEKVSELPAVKELIGRVTQSVRDQTRAEIERAAREAAQIADATREGKAAKSKLTTALKAATEALDSDDPEAVVELPTDEAVEKAFEDYADAAVGEYHTRAWNALSESIYTLPEFGGTLPEGYDGPPVPELTQAQKDLLNSVKGADATVWLAAHLTVQRDVLWDWATQHQNGDLAAKFEQEKVQIQAAHTNEVKQLTKAHEKALADARDDERAKAIADAAAGRLPIKTPNAKGATNEVDPNANKPKRGATLREVNQWAKEQHEAAAVTGRDA